MQRIMTSGDLELDNNAIERQMKPIALGRKNYLFAGSHEGAHQAWSFTPSLTPARYASYIQCSTSLMYSAVSPQSAD
jgi:hypothetical protein